MSHISGDTVRLNGTFDISNTLYVNKLIGSNYTNVSLGNNSSMKLGNNSSISLGNNSSVSLGSNSKLTLSNIVSNSIKANVIDLSDNSNPYIYFNRNQNSYIMYSSNNLYTNSNFHINGIIKTNRVYMYNSSIVDLNNNALVTFGNNSTIRLGNNTIINASNFSVYSNTMLKFSTNNYLQYYITNNTIATRNINININGNINATGTVKASKVFNAVYNDYAELYEKDNIDEVIKPGDVIEINPETGKYRKSIIFNSKYVVGVCSNTYGHLIGGKAEYTEEENLKYYIPIGLCGRVYVKVNNRFKDIINIGDLLVSDGHGKVSPEYTVDNRCSKSHIIGKALSEVVHGKVLMQIILS